MISVVMDPAGAAGLNPAQALKLVQDHPDMEQILSVLKEHPHIKYYSCSRCGGSRFGLSCVCNVVDSVAFTGSQAILRMKKLLSTSRTPWCLRWILAR